MATFLELNGYSLNIPETEVVLMMEGLASGEETQESIAESLQENSVQHE